VVLAARAWPLVLAVVAAPPDPRPPETEPSDRGAEGETVFTFYGLLTLEEDASVADAEKVRQWRAFIRRAEQQLAYAREAISRWEDASRRRRIERALATESDPQTSAPDRAAAWTAAAEAQIHPEAAEKARRRAAFWAAEHARALVVAAKAVEADGRPKVERIRAWKAVVDWPGAGEAAAAAGARIRLLADQLFLEAESLDGVAGVDRQTKRDAWTDVLEGAPTDAQRTKARTRLRALAAR
jgi:hypothetical protein